MTTPADHLQPPASPRARRVVVLGASGGIGSAITTELADRDLDVVAVNRGGNADVPEGVERRAADLLDATSTKAACADADVVVLAAQPTYPRWLGEWPTMLEHTLAAVEAAGARLVFVDNLYAHAPAEGPLNEDSAEHATDPKGALRRELGRTVLEAHRQGRVRATIGRFSDYFGPGGTNSGIYMTGIGPGLAGRTMRALHDADQTHAFAYLPDAARAFAALVEDDRADGRTWYLPHLHATQREVLELVAERTGNHKRIGTIGPLMLRVGGWFDQMIRESRSTSVQFDRPWTVDSSAFEAAFGPFELTPLDDAVADTVAWFRANGGAS